MPDTVGGARPRPEAGRTLAPGPTRVTRKPRLTRRRDDDPVLVSDDDRITHLTCAVRCERPAVEVSSPEDRRPAA